VVKIVDRSGNEVNMLREEPGFGLSGVTFSPDGRLLATKHWPTARIDPTAEQVRIVDWRRGKVVKTIATPAEALAFDPTGTRIATSHPYAGSATIWDVESGQTVATLSGHEGPILDLAFGPDGSVIATASYDGTVRLWDAGSAEQTVALHGHTGAVRWLSFSPDGSKLASGGVEVRIWALDIDDLIDIAHANLTRALTAKECQQYLHVEPCPQA